MTSYPQRLRALMDRSFIRYRRLSPGQVELSSMRVLQQLRRTPEWHWQTRPSHSSGVPAADTWSRRRVVSVAVAATLLAVIAVPAIREIVSRRGAIATVEIGDGSLYRAAADDTVALETAARIAWNDVVRSDKGHGCTLALSDGSKVEMRAQADLSLERADDGVRIRLRTGSIIVTAAKQRSGHLYVQTKDVTVSVVGTVFLVSAEDDGSHVAVVEGVVRVREKDTETNLRPGEQISTGLTHEARAVKDEIAWSRNLQRHLSLMAPLLLVAAQQIPPSPQPPRDAARPAAPSVEPAQRATAVVRGRVTAAGSGDPVYRVGITMSNGSTPVATGATGATLNASQPTAVTGDDGRFEIRNVPAGRYAVTATRSGYLSIQYGQQRPRELGQPVMVRDGEVVENIDIVLFKGAVLAGRILNEQGEPSVGVRIEAMDLRYTRGRRALASAAFGTTDDLGEFRIGGLDPGTYYVRAATVESWGDEDPTRSGYAYALTYYPGVVGSDRAQPISLATGQEAANLDFSLVVGRAARISGRVEGAGGEPAAGQSVGLTRVTPGAPLGTFLHGPVQTDRTGAFEILNIPPGEYWLRAGTGAAYAITPVFVVEDADVSGLVVTFNRPGNLSGTIVSEDQPATPPAGVRIVPVQVDEGSRPPSLADGNSPQPAAANGSFRFMNIRGTYLFRTEGLPAEWMLKAVRLNDRDITDTPFEIPQGRDTTGLQLVVTRSAGTVAGDVINANGAAESRSTVIVFSADDRRWGYSTRFVKAARPDKTGAFMLGGLPPGSYFAVAREFVADGQWNDPDFLRSLIGAASRVELTENQTSTVKLTVMPETTR